MSISNTRQPDQVSCGYYAAYAVSVVNKRKSFHPNLPMTRALVEAARAKTPNPRVYLQPMLAPHFLRSACGVKIPYKSGDSRMVSLDDVARCLAAHRGCMLGNQSHWVALCGIHGDTIDVYNSGGAPHVTIMPLEMIVHSPYLVHPIDW